MNKTPKNKAEKQVWRSGKAYLVASDYQTPAEKAAETDIITRMEEAQQRFPSLLQSSEDERRILRNAPPFDAQAEHENDLRYESRVDYESWQYDGPAETEDQ